MVDIWLPTDSLVSLLGQLLTLLLIWPLTFLTQTAGTATTPLPPSLREPLSPSYWPQVRLYWSQVCFQLLWIRWFTFWIHPVVFFLWLVRSNWCSVIETISSSCFLQPLAAENGGIWFSIPFLSGISQCKIVRASVCLILTSNEHMDLYCRYWVSVSQHDILNDSTTLLPSAVCFIPV